MSTFTIEPGLFFGLTDEQRRTITRVIQLATTKTHDAHAKVSRTAKGIEAQTLIVDANDMLMDLFTAVKQDGNLIKNSDGTLYKASRVVEDGTAYISVTKWEPESWAWRMSFSLPIEDGETEEQARQRAVRHILKG